MTTKMELPLLLFCLWVAAMVALLMGLRLRDARRKLQVLNKEITSLVYVAAFVPLLLIGQLIPMTLMVFLVVWIVVAFPFSYQLNRKYNLWLAEKLKDKERQDNLEELRRLHGEP